MCAATDFRFGSDSHIGCRRRGGLHALGRRPFSQHRVSERCRHNFVAWLQPGSRRNRNHRQNRRSCQYDFRHRHLEFDFAGRLFDCQHSIRAGKSARCRRAGSARQSRSGDCSFAGKRRTPHCESFQYQRRADYGDDTFGQRLVARSDRIRRQVLATPHRKHGRRRSRFGFGRTRAPDQRTNRRLQTAFLQPLSARCDARVASAKHRDSGRSRRRRRPHGDFAHVGTTGKNRRFQQHRFACGKRRRSFAFRCRDY